MDKMRYFLYKQSFITKEEIEFISLPYNLNKSQFVAVLDNLSEEEDCTVTMKIYNQKDELVQSFDNLLVQKFNDLYTDIFEMEPNYKLRVKVDDTSSDEIEVHFSLLMIISKDLPVPPKIERPAILNYNYLNTNLEVKSTPFQVKQGEVVHSNTEYIISRYSTGISSEFRFKTELPVEEYIQSNIELEKGIDWYIFVRYLGNNGTVKSEWSYPVNYYEPKTPPIIYAPDIITPANDQVFTNNLDSIKVICSSFKASDRCIHSSTEYIVYMGAHKEVLKTAKLGPVKEFEIDISDATYKNIELKIRYNGNNDSIQGEYGYVSFKISGNNLIVSGEKLFYNTYRSFFIDTSDNLYGWGWDHNGDLGINTPGRDYGWVGHYYSSYYAQPKLIARNVRDVYNKREGCSYYITTDNDLYAVGTNETCQLGLGPNIERVTEYTKIASNVNKIAIVGLFNNKPPYKFCTWYLSYSGDLYCSGYNFEGYDYPLQGHAGEGYQTFTRIASNVKDFKVNEKVSWYLTNNGDLYGCGRNNNGVIGVGYTCSNLVEFGLRATNVKEIVHASDYLTLYISKDDELFGCGLNYHGQLCLKPSYSNVVQPSFAKLASNISKVFFVSDNDPGKSSIWYLSKNNDLYSVGYNDTGLQGTGKFGKSTLYYNDIDVYSFEKRASNVKKFWGVGSSCVWYLTSNNELYSAGYNWFGTHGAGHRNPCVRFELRATNVRDFNFVSGYVSHQSQSYISGFIEGYMAYSTYIITENNELYSCGYDGGTYELGLGKTTQVYKTYTKVADNVKKLLYIGNGIGYYLSTDNRLYQVGLDVNSKGNYYRTSWSEKQIPSAN